MKIIIDSTAMTISVIEDVSLKDLMSKLDELFPDNTWENYKLLAPANPVPSPFIPYPIYPTFPTFPAFPYEPYSPTHPAGPYFYSTSSGSEK